MTNVAIAVVDGVLDSALAVTLDVLAAANRVAAALGHGPPFRARVLSIDGAAVTTGAGYAHGVDGAFSSRARHDVVLVLGINAPLRDELEAALERDDVRALVAFVEAASRRGALVGASCSGTFVAALAGVFDGGAATTSWWIAPLFRARFPSIELRADATIVASKRAVSAGAALSQIDLALWLVRRVAGPSVAELVARYLVVDERPSQVPFAIVDHVQHASEEVLRAERFVREHLAERLSIARIARAARASPRTLARRLAEALGMTPGELVRRLRVERALHLLRSTKLPVGEVARAVGYEDAATLRRNLRRATGRSARALRLGLGAARAFR